MKLNSQICFALLLAFLLLGCSTDDPGLPPGNINLTSGPDIILNPSGVAPLTATVTLKAKTAIKVQLTVLGMDGEESDVSYTTPMATEFEIPVLGLYPGHDNTIELQYMDADGNSLGSQNLTATTDPLITDLPQIEVNERMSASMMPGFNLVNYFGYAGNPRPQRPFMFDQFGKIRWYLDFSKSTTLSNLFYDNGMSRMQNGNLLFGDGSTHKIYEINMLGEIVSTWSLLGYSFHHQVIEKPTGNFLVTVSDPSKTTIEDVIIEIDRNSGSIIKRWDLNQSLDNSRRAWTTDLYDMTFDWFHANGLYYDADDNSIVVSGRTQGVVKLTEDNEVVWILAPHRDWNLSGHGSDLTTKLLQPLDGSNIPITDPLVLDGAESHPEFQWAWYQHSPIVMPDGNIMVFDNGENRNYTGNETYSRAVVFNINEEDMSIRQVWDYGQARGIETFSKIVSKVNYYESSNTVLFCPGAAQKGAAKTNVGKVIEVDYSTGQVVFEATITPPLASFSITFHSVIRMPIYP